MIETSRHLTSDDFIWAWARLAMEDDFIEASSNGRVMFFTTQAEYDRLDRIERAVRGADGIHVYGTPVLVCDDERLYANKPEPLIGVVRSR